MTTIAPERPSLPASWLPEDELIDVFARRRKGVWAAEIPAFQVEAGGATRSEAITNAWDSLHARLAAAADEGQSYDEARQGLNTRVLVLAVILSVVGRVLSDREYARLPLRTLEDLDAERETEAVLADPELLADLRASAEDVATGRVITLEDLRRELGLA